MYIYIYMNKKIFVGSKNGWVGMVVSHAESPKKLPGDACD